MLMADYFDEEFGGNYLFTKQFEPIKNIKQDCAILQQLILNKFGPDHPEASREVYFYGSYYTALFKKYNALLTPTRGFYELYNLIKECFHNLPESEKRDEPFYAQCWMNMYDSDHFIDWHKHWDAEYDVWHGFYCASIPSDSGTWYRIPSLSEELYIPSVEGKMVIGKSADDMHKSTPVNGEEKRITIAFDIVPCSVVQQDNDRDKLNFWIPI